jgi:hypothetical protein
MTGALMARYRLCLTGGHRHQADVRECICMTDDVALSMAIELACEALHSVEIWKKARLIARVYHTRVAGLRST